MPVPFRTFPCSIGYYYSSLEFPVNSSFPNVFELCFIECKNTCACFSACIQNKIAPKSLNSQIRLSGLFLQKYSKHASILLKTRYGTCTYTCNIHAGGVNGDDVLMLNKTCAELKLLTSNGHSLAFDILFVELKDKLLGVPRLKVCTHVSTCRHIYLHVLTFYVIAVHNNANFVSSQKLGLSFLWM